jgi:hypothetical protein
MLAIHSIGRSLGLHEEYDPPSPPYDLFGALGARSMFMVSIANFVTKKDEDV